MRVAWARFGQRFGRPRVSANYQINRSYHSHEATFPKAAWSFAYLNFLHEQRGQVIYECNGTTRRTTRKV